MSHLLTDLGEPYAWSIVPESWIARWIPQWARKAPSETRAALVVRHPSGHVLHVYNGGHDWSVAEPPGAQSAVELARFSKMRGHALTDFQHDLDAVYGADARARRDRVLHRIMLFCVVHGITAKVQVNEVFIGLHPPLPRALKSEISACRHILQPSQQNKILIPLLRVRLAIPATTAHERMAFLSEARQDGILIEEDARA